MNPEQPQTSSAHQDHMAAAPVVEAIKGACPENVLQAIYGTVDKAEEYQRSLSNWWREYATRKNDEEDEHVADSLLYDRQLANLIGLVVLLFC